MKRRNFIINSSLAGISFAASGADSGMAKSLPANSKTNHSELSDDFELNEITISELQDLMNKGKYTSEQITKLYLQRIDEMDKHGHNLNAIIELNPDAISIAKSMDRERKSGKTKGPLHGIPILIKDNIDTADKMLTTAGSLALMDNIAAKDAFIVQKLRDAGAVLLGKTNLSEWANFRSSKSCSGWSSRGGQTKNPYILDHNPCGSSSGSAVAVSSNLCTVAIGTETDGSITSPASVNGIVGIKPTVGLVSRSGIVPISSTQDTAGPIARTVKDAAILLSVITGVDAGDEKSKESSGKSGSDYTAFLTTNGMKGKRIGVERKKYDNLFLNSLFQRALDTIKKLGAQIIELDYYDKLHSMEDAEFELLKYEFKYGINKYLANRNLKMKYLKDIIDFNKNHEDKVMPTFKQDILEACEAKSGIRSKEYTEALLKSHTGSQKYIDTLMKENKLDAFCGLTMGPACSIDTIYGDRWGDVFLTAPAAMSGYPHISVPAGFVFDLPVGLSIFSGAYMEGTIISMAYTYEQASKNRMKPSFQTAFLK